MTSAKTNMGRNDPCHCGSGEKYKKCCLEADQREREQTTTPEATPEDSEERSQPLGSFQNDYVPEEEQTDWDEPEEESGGFGTSTTDAPMRRYPRPPEIPEGSPEVSAIVDAWWEQFIPAFRKGDLDTMLSMIETFLAEHPDKVPQLFLHEEVLLDLSGFLLGRWNAGVCRASVSVADGRLPFGTGTDRFRRKTIPAYHLPQFKREVAGGSVVGGRRSSPVCRFPQVRLLFIRMTRVHVMFFRHSRFQVQHFITPSPMLFR